MNVSDLSKMGASNSSAFEKGGRELIGREKMLKYTQGARQHWLCNLHGSVQNQNAGPLDKNYKEFREGESRALLVHLRGLHTPAWAYTATKPAREPEVQGNCHYSSQPCRATVSSCYPNTDLVITVGLIQSRHWNVLFPTKCLNTLNSYFIF